MVVVVEWENGTHSEGETHCSGDGGGHVGVVFCGGFMFGRVIKIGNWDWDCCITS